jgi:hypothetical protein
MKKTLNELDFKFLNKNEKGYSVHFSLPDFKNDDKNKNQFTIEQITQSLFTKREDGDYEEYYKYAVNTLRSIKSRNPILFNSTIDSLKTNSDFTDILNKLTVSLDFSNEYEELTQKELTIAKTLLIESKELEKNVTLESDEVKQKELSQQSKDYLKKGINNINTIFSNLNLSIDIDPFSAYIIQDIAMFLVEFKLTTEFDYFFKKVSYICHIHSVIDPENIPKSITEIEDTLLKSCYLMDDKTLVSEIKQNLNAV